MSTASDHDNVLTRLNETFNRILNYTPPAPAFFRSEVSGQITVADPHRLREVLSGFVDEQEKRGTPVVETGTALKQLQFDFTDSTD